MLLYVAIYPLSFSFTQDSLLPAAEGKTWAGGWLEIASYVACVRGRVVK